MTVSEKRRARAALDIGPITITLGVHDSEGSERKQGATDDTTVADVGTFHEFGTSTIPARSFIRGWFDESQAFIAETLTVQFKAAASGKRTVPQAAERCALAFEGSVKQRISRNIPPPLAASTIARKGSSVALVDTGQLRAAVRGVVTVGKAKS